MHRNEWPSDLRYRQIENRIFLEKLYAMDIKNNPLKNSRWYSPKKENIYDSEHMEELKIEGYTLVEVYGIPETSEGMPSYIFAKDSNNNEYYLHVHYFEFGWNKWGYITIGDKLAIKYGALKKNSTSSANEIRMIDKVEHSVFKGNKYY